MATCSSDRTIKVFDVSNPQKQQLVSQLKGHGGPVWQVSWSHPANGNYLASCSYDHKVIIWKEVKMNQWVKCKEYVHKASVNSISWAPYQFGLCLAAGCSDGSISIIKCEKGEWKHQSISKAHNGGCMAVSWAPITGSIDEDKKTEEPRLVTGGCDKKVKIWQKEDNSWTEDSVLSQHKDWVRDVSWAPNIGLSHHSIASCSQDFTVIIWSCPFNGISWSHKHLVFKSIVWRVSWSITGNILAVSTADNDVTLWKEDLKGEWKKISSLKEKK